MKIVPGKVSGAGGGVMGSNLILRFFSFFFLAGGGSSPFPSDAVLEQHRRVRQ